MAWRLTYEGEVYPESGLTLGQIERLENELSLSWLEINPIRSARQARRVLALVHADRTGADHAVVLDRLESMTVAEWEQVFEIVTDADDLPTQFENGLPQKGAGT